MRTLIHSKAVKWLSVRKSLFHLLHFILSFVSLSTDAKENKQVDKMKMVKMFHHLLVKTRSAEHMGTSAEKANDKNTVPPKHKLY